MKLSPSCSLHTVRGPHNLRNTRVRQNYLLKKFGTGIIHLKTGVVLGMPVSSPKHKVKLPFFPESVDNRECRFVILDTKTSVGAEVILHIHN